MTDFTHRDRRAHREVGRAFWTVLGLSLGLTGVALAVPLPYAGLVAVVGLGVVGAVYLGWADRTLARYASDLRQTQDGTATDGFVRAETGTAVGLDRDGSAVPSPSPHVRRRSRSGSGGDASSPAEARSGRGQA